MKTRPIRTRSPAARALRDPRHRNRVIPDKRGNRLARVSNREAARAAHAGDFICAAA